MLDWDKNKTVNISTVSETFGIPASTLRYWESMGLITLGRRDNNYREYSYSSLLNLSDICYLRNLGIPVKAIKEYQTLSLADSNALYLNKKSELEAQISSLQSTYSMLRKTLSLMNIFRSTLIRKPSLIYRSFLVTPNFMTRRYGENTFPDSISLQECAWVRRIANGFGDGLQNPASLMRSLHGPLRKETATLCSLSFALT